MHPTDCLYASLFHLALYFLNPAASRHLPPFLPSQQTIPFTRFVPLWHPRHRDLAATSSSRAVATAICARPPAAAPPQLSIAVVSPCINCYGQIHQRVKKSTTRMHPQSSLFSQHYFLVNHLHTSNCCKQNEFNFMAYNKLCVIFWFVCVVCFSFLRWDMKGNAISSLGLVFYAWPFDVWFHTYGWQKCMP